MCLKMKWWKKRKLLTGLSLYRDSLKTLAVMRDDSGRLPEELNHYVKDLLKQRQEWLSQIEKLKAEHVLSEEIAAELKRGLDQ